MSRRWGQRFGCASLDDLARQLMFAPADKRIEQCRRAEGLHDELEGTTAYPLDYVAYRVTGHRRRARGEADAPLLVGAAVSADLRLLIDQLSRSTDMPWEPARTAAQLADDLKVSVKTVTRWRHAGLRWRWMTPPGAQRQEVFFLPQAVEHYVARHRHRVEKASSFSQISQADRLALLQQAQRMVQARPQASLNQVAADLAQRTGRALETLRLLLEKHDRDHPDQALFAHRAGPLTARQRRVIARAYRMGLSADQLARRYRRTRSTIYRAIRRQRAASAQRMVLPYAPSPIFDRPDADEVMLSTGLDGLAPEKSMPMSRVAVDDLPAPLPSLYRQPRLDAGPVRSLLIRYHYLYFKASQIRAGLDRDAPRVRDLDRFDDCLAQARALRDGLVRIHLPSVLSVARRHQVGQPQPRLASLLELLLEGHAVLLKSLGTFNPHRSTQFNAYLTHQLLRHFASGQAADADRPRAQRRLRESQLCDQLLKRLAESGIVP